MKKRKDCWEPNNYQEIIQFSSSQFWRFIQKNAKEVSPTNLFLDLTKLSSKDLARLSSLHFILSEEIKDFVYITAPQILNRLSKSTINELKESQGRIRGRVHWHKTYTYRYANGGDSSLYICSQRSSIFDLTENRVLLYLLNKVFLTAKSFSRIELSDKHFDFEVENSQKWIKQVEEIGHQCYQLLRNPYIKEIKEIYDLNDRHIEDTEKRRSKWYKDLSDVARNYLHSLESPLFYLRKSLSNKVFEPLNKDTLYEIAVLFRIIGCANMEGWNEVKLSLIGNGSKVISELKKNNQTLRIYYQGLPTEFAKISKYGKLMSSYGLSNKLRRPDMIMEFIEDNQRRYCIVEVKRSKNRSYLVDGAYKLLGYLKDYEEVKNVSKVQGVLVGWSNINRGSVSSDNEIYMAIWSNLDQIISAILNSKN
ncbi:hypothetical protein I0292_26560 (plasmid) [Priestia megaterium]|uniref:hypothetical protein n=1 Tax=Priestia megaterium TaxID=1404 RepID=UPI00205EC9A0|nr:hypothetical protein [Priestia megaterium]UOO43812.1 hypothetical protein I0292_26560 [Priestia megaterium]